MDQADRDALNSGWEALRKGEWKRARLLLEEVLTRVDTPEGWEGFQFGVAELEAVGLGIEGQALVSEGELDEGMRRLDEATATALAGEAESLICVAWAGCYVIAACKQVRDYERAESRSSVSVMASGSFSGRAEPSTPRSWPGRVDGVRRRSRLYVEDHGNGEPVPLLHGWPDSSQLWRHQIPTIVGAGFRLIVPCGGLDALTSLLRWRRTRWAKLGDRFAGPRDG